MILLPYLFGMVLASCPFVADICCTITYLVPEGLLLLALLGMATRAGIPPLIKVCGTELFTCCSTPLALLLSSSSVRSTTTCFFGGLTTVGDLCCGAIVTLCIDCDCWACCWAALDGVRITRCCVWPAGDTVFVTTVDVIVDVLTAVLFTTYGWGEMIFVCGGLGVCFRTTIFEFLQKITIIDWTVHHVEKLPFHNRPVFVA